MTSHYFCFFLFQTSWPLKPSARTRLFARCEAILPLSFVTIKPCALLSANGRVSIFICRGRSVCSLWSALSEFWSFQFHKHCYYIRRRLEWLRICLTFIWIFVCDCRMAIINPSFDELLLLMVIVCYYLTTVMTSVELIINEINWVMWCDVMRLV